MVADISIAVRLISVISLSLNSDQIQLSSSVAHFSPHPRVCKVFGGNYRTVKAGVTVRSGQKINQDIMLLNVYYEETAA